MDLEKILGLTDSEKIKMYLAYKDVEEEEKRTVKRTGKKKASYSVPFASGLDAIIERVEKKEVKQLIIMPSQDKYLFKKDSMIQEVDKTTFEEFATFFDAIGTEGISVNSIPIEKINATDVHLLYKMIKEQKEALREGIMSLSLFKNKNLFEVLSKEPKVWTMLAKETPILTNQEKYDEIFVALVQKFHLHRSYDAARKFAESYTKSSMSSINGHRYGYYYSRYYHRENKTFSLIEQKDLETKRLIEYLCFDLYAQGFDAIPFFTYEDYLRMSLEYEGKIRNKYPKALLTEHDVMALKYRIHKEEIDERKFQYAVENIKKFLEKGDGSQFSYKNIQIVIPKSGNDLIDEGQALGHCVGSYVSRMQNGECVIVFARRKSDLSRNYLTIELRPINEFGGEDNFCIAQIQGDCKRTELEAEEIEFFEKFMDETGLKTTNSNFSDRKYRI